MSQNSDNIVYSFIKDTKNYMAITRTDTWMSVYLNFNRLIYILVDTWLAPASQE